MRRHQPGPVSHFHDRPGRHPMPSFTDNLRAERGVGSGAFLRRATRQVAEALTWQLAANTWG
jgi:hypothetical protein